MDDLNSEFVDVEDLKENFSFIERLANYYSDFLSTDFKKGNLPKRRFQTRDKKVARAASAASVKRSPSKNTKLTCAGCGSGDKWR